MLGDLFLHRTDNVESIKSHVAIVMAFSWQFWDIYWPYMITELRIGACVGFCTYVHHFVGVI
jgi:hypothetical protein